MLCKETKSTVSQLMRPIVVKDLFGEVGRRDLQAIDLYFSTREVPKGTLIFEEGSAAEEIWLMISGSALMSFSGQPNDRPVVEGELLGITELFAGVPRIGTLTTTEDSVFKTIDERTIDRLLTAYPRVRTAILEELANNYFLSYSAMVESYPRVT